MTVILPKRRQFEKIYPFNTTATARTAGVSGTPSAYAQIVSAANMTKDFVLMGAYANVVFTESSASYSGAIPVQFQIATGAAASEVPVAGNGYAMGIQFNVGTGGVAQIGYGNFYRLPPKLIPAGTRIAVRAVTSSAHGALSSFYIVGYEPETGFPLPRPWDFEDDNIEYFMRGMKVTGSDMAPSMAWNSITSHATTTFGTYGAIVEMIASAATDILITDVLTTIQNTISVSTHAIYEVGIGAGGSEEWYSVVGSPGFAALPGPPGGDMQLARPLFVKAGERVACRMSSSPANKTVEIALVYTILK